MSRHRLALIARTEQGDLVAYCYTPSSRFGACPVSNATDSDVGEVVTVALEESGTCEIWRGGE